MIHDAFIARPTPVATKFTRVVVGDYVHRVRRSALPLVVRVDGRLRRAVWIRRRAARLVLLSPDVSDAELPAVLRLIQAVGHVSDFSTSGTQWKGGAR